MTPIIPKLPPPRPAPTIAKSPKDFGTLGLNAAIPEGVRALAEKTVDQTREAYDRSTDAFEASVATFERSFDAAGQGAAAFNRKIIDIARRNVSSQLRPGQEPGRRQEPRRYGRAPDGLLAASSSAP